MAKVVTEQAPSSHISPVKVATPAPEVAVSMPIEDQNGHDEDAAREPSP